jgi:hypothetical protein
VATDDHRASPRHDTLGDTSNDDAQNRNT